MPSGMVSGVTRRMGVLDGGPHVPREGEVLGFFRSSWFEWHIFNRNVFNSCMQSWGLWENMQKM